MRLWISRTPLLLQYSIGNGLKFAVLAALFQAAEGSLDGGMATYVVYLKEERQQTPELILWKKEAKAGVWSIWWSFHCCAYLNFAFSLGSRRHPECLPTPLYAQEMGIKPKPASWVTYPAVITMEKENNREKENTQNQVVGCQNHTFLCFKIPMESALCNSVCTLFLQSIPIPG